MIMLKKMFRDIWKKKTQFIAILIMSALGIMVFSGLESVHSALQNDSNAMYQKSNLADIWTFTKAIDEIKVDELRGIKGIKNVEGKMNFTSKVGNSSLDICAIDSNEISKPLIISGDKFTTVGSGIWLNQKYGEANNLKIGDDITVANQKLRIRGFVLSSEKIYIDPSKTYMKDNLNFGYGFISKDTAVSLMGGFKTNEIDLKVNDGTDTIAVQNDIEKVLGSEYITSMDRSQNINIDSIKSKIYQLKIFTYIFPGLFFALAILTMFTTMTRLIESQRIQIGTLMSQGYSKAKLMRHYLAYGLWMGLFGGIIGLIAGRLFIVTIIQNSLKSIYVLDKWSNPLTLLSVVSAIVIVLCCVIAVYLSLRNKLHEMPAAILHVKIDKKDKRRAFEKLKIFKKMGFENKSIIRNILNNKIRSIMGIIGVLGCIVLVLAGLGMRDSLNENFEMMFGSKYQYKVAVINPSTTADSLGLSKENTMEIEEGKGEIRKGNNRQIVSYNVSENNPLVNTLDNEGKEVVSPEKGLGISDRMASLLGVKVGDIVDFHQIGKGWIPVEIGKIDKIAIPKDIVISKSAWKDIGNNFRTTSILVGDTNRDVISLKNDERVAEVITKSDEKNSMEKVLSGVNLIVYIFILAALVLGAAILYSLGTLNIAEMSREYATLKVVGLYPREIRWMAIKENLFLTIIGIVIGIPCGIMFLNYFMSLLSSDYIMFFPYINNSSYLIALGVTLFCSIGVNLILSLKINRIDMVSSLKANE